MRKQNLTEALIASIRNVRGFNEAEDDDKRKEDEEIPSFEEEEEWEGEEEEEEEEGAEGEEEVSDFESEGDDDGDEEEFDDEDFDIEDDGDLEDEFTADDLETEGDPEGELPDGVEDPESLLANDPPEHDAFGDEDMGMDGDDVGINKSSEFSEFITNQLIDYPVENVDFVEYEGAKYVDAKFGDKAVSFCLYTGEHGEPYLGILYDNEVYRVELPNEAVEGDGKVRNEFMPVDWIRDNLAKLVDTAPEFECYRLKKRSSNCNETRKIRRRVVTMRESCCGPKRKAITAPRSAKKKPVTKGKKSAGGKKAALGGGKLTPPAKSGGKAALR